MRKKYIYELKTRKVQPNRAELVLRCQGGLYIKELISGDGGRTKPSVERYWEFPQNVWNSMYWMWRWVI